MLFLLKKRISLYKVGHCLESIIWMPQLTLGLVCLQIRRWQKAQKKARPPSSRRPRTRRSSSRRSGYAFAHQEGYGELITSGKNMRAKNPPPTSGLEKTHYNSTSWIENLCKKTTDTVSSFGQDKTVKLWVNMNLNHIVIFSLQVELKFCWLQSLRFEARGGAGRLPHLTEICGRQLPMPIKQECVLWKTRPEGHCLVCDLVDKTLLQVQIFFSF